MAKIISDNFKLILLAILTIFEIATATNYGSTNGRQIKTEINPGCNIPECSDGNNGSFANIAYIKSEATTDTLHYIISSIGSMSVLVLRGKPGSSISIDWEKLISDNSSERTDSAITLEPQGSLLPHSYGVVFTRMFEYNDTQDAASIDYYDESEVKKITNWTVLNFSGDFGWQKIVQEKSNTNSVVFNISMVANGNESMSENNTVGTLSFTFNAYDNDGRQSSLPKMEYNMNNTIMEFLLNNYTASYTQSRFALEVVMIGTSQEDPVISVEQSLDDEYTPGVFKMTSWSTKPSQTSLGGYLEWKPICYTDSGRGRASGTSVKNYIVTDGTTQKPFLENSIVYSFFGEQLFSKDIQNGATNISFGLSSDGFYTKTNYTVWSSSIGYGTPPEDTVSTLVIGVISAGLGIPVIIILSGGVYVLVKRHKSSKSQVMRDLSTSYSQING